MKLHILPFGRPAWERRREIIREIIGSPVPPYDFRGVLYLVPNERTVKTLKTLFLDVLKEATGAGACIPPRFDTLNKFLNGKVMSLSDKPLIDKISRGLVLEEICGRAAGRMRGVGVPPDVLGPSLAPGVSDALDRLYTYGVNDRALAGVGSDRLSMSLLLSVKDEYEAWLDSNGLADPSREKALYSPGPADFSRDYTAVVLDGFYDADPAETRLLAALSRIPGCAFVLDAPGLDRGESHQEGMPYFGADRFLDSLGVDIKDLKTGGDHSLAAVFSGALYEGRPLRETLAALGRMGPLASDIRVVGALNPLEEAYYIAGSIKEGLISRKINSPGRVLVFSPAPDDYLPLIGEAFSELGIPFHVSQGYPLMQSMVVAALLNLLRVPLDGYSFRGIRKVLASPLVLLNEGGNRPEAFDRFARREKVTGGRARWRERLARPQGAPEDAALARRPLARLLDIAEGMETKSQSLGKWAADISRLMDSAGITAAAGSRKTERPELSCALDKLREALGRLKDASSGLKRNIRLSEFVYILRGSLSKARYHPGPDKVSGVRVLGSLETLSEPFDVIYACGLREGQMPRARRHDIFFTDEDARSLGMPAGGDERTRDARLFLGLILGAPSVFLCCPETVNGSPATPSPYIRALEPFLKSGAIRRETRACRPLAPGLALSPEGLLRAAALGAAGGRLLSGLLESIPSDTPGMDRAREVLSPLPPSPQPKLPPPHPPDVRRFTVTELEEYRLCHYRYYHTRVAHSAPEEEPDDDIAPHMAGSAVHEILREFYTRTAAVTEGSREEALEILREVAVRKFERLPDTARNRELARRFTGFLAPRFIEAEVELSRTGFTVCGTELPIAVEVEDPDAGHIVITGKIDRLEMDKEGDFAVVDYKTGGYPGSGRPLGEMFQLPLYAHAVKKDIAAKAGRTPRPSGLVYYNLRDGKMRDVAAYDKDVPGASVRGTPGRRGRSAAEMDDLINGSLAAALEAVRGILAGDFRPTCGHPYVCETCLYLKVCVKGKAMDGGDAGEG